MYMEKIPHKNTVVSTLGPHKEVLGYPQECLCEGGGGGCVGACVSTNIWPQMDSLHPNKTKKFGSMLHLGATHIMVVFRVVF